MLEKIILFYKFFPVADGRLFRLWQLELAGRCQLTGRVIVAPAGLNATLAGDLNQLRAYIRALRQLPELKAVAIKWSAGQRSDFPGLSVKLRPELVSLKPETDFDVYNSGAGLSPRAWHQFLTDNPETTVLDARNHYEHELGYFDVRNLIRLPIKTFAQIKSHLSQLAPDKPLLTYCTGDVRCEYLSAYLQGRGFARVHHLEGGIIRYGQEFGDDGFWRGSCYVFDKRRRLTFSRSSPVVGRCCHCRQPSDNQINCDDCNRQVVVCPGCQQQRSHCQ